MKNGILEEREYEDVDDLPLFEHIEWSHSKKNPVSPISSPPKHSKKDYNFVTRGDEKGVAVRSEN